MTQAIQKSKGTKLYLALLPVGVRAKPTEQILTTSGASNAAIAKSATSIPLEAAVDGLIPKGQWLLFKDGDGVERLAQLSADAVDGATALAVYALPEAIADGATAEFPVRIQARSGASVSRSANLQSSITFDSGSERDGTTTSRERGLSAAGNYLYYDAGLRTAEYAYENDQEVWVKRVLPAPSSAYSIGKVTEGPAAVTSIPDEVPADGFVSQSLEVAFLGYCSETQPKPTT
ncbi:MAG: phage tail tube protein [Nostoc sp. EkiNYC01]|nr:phage tail tube protein [Nostoc sp. EkiNYC01]